MAKGEYHIGKNGPAPCNADPSKPGGRACRYESSGHFETAESAEAAYGDNQATFAPLSKRAVAEIHRPLEKEYSADELLVMRQYRDGANWTLNGNLRKGASFSEKAAHAVATIDSLIEKAQPLTAPALVMRSLETGAGTEYNIPSKGIYSDPAFLSTSTSSAYIEATLQDGVDAYSDHPSDTIMTIEVPAGSKVLAFSLENPDYAEEAEVILPRGTQLEILEDSGFIDGVRRLKARMLFNE